MQDPLYLVIAVRQVVVFPHSVVPLSISREKFMNTLREATSRNQPIVLVAQKDANVEDPKTEDIYSVGTLATIVQTLELPDKSLKVIVKAQTRITLVGEEKSDDFLQFYGRELATICDNQKETIAFRRLVIEELGKYFKATRKSSDFVLFIQKIEDTAKMLDLIVAQLPMPVSLKQQILEMAYLDQRLELVLTYLKAELEVFQTEKRILKRIKDSVETQQRAYVQDIRKQAIQQEMGEHSEYDIVRERIQSAKLPPEAKEKAEAVLTKLMKMNPMSSEASVERSYLDCLLELPWKKKSRLYKDLGKAEEILNKNHDGLKKVKELILEVLAVQNRTQKTQGKVLCLVGPPGVGKTSLGKSIAHATGRRFARISLGGVRDEAELRGHRRTYVGAMPGKILKAMRKVRCTNPLILLDEVDKMGTDLRGDPASALLEILDPEQNDAFQDHYVEVGYDLSNVLFICTANIWENIPLPLIDRMEVIKLSGYTEEEKLKIAQNHLVPSETKQAGLREEEFQLTEDALRRLIRFYCREAGVRTLNRWISTLARKAVKSIDLKEIPNLHVTQEGLEKYIGAPRFTHAEASEFDTLGVSNGLAWTEMGGHLLFVEVVAMPGKGKILSTGKLGDVMRESVQTAASFVRSRAVAYGIDPTFFETHDLHVHVPEGAIPKDGPSAGTAICVAIMSILTQKLARKDVAMTGEISLSGKVWPIGGLKEKILAARQAGIKTVLIPEGNIKDLEEIPENVRNSLEIIPVKNVDAVLTHALISAPTVVGT